MAESSNKSHFMNLTVRRLYYSSIRLDYFYPLGGVRCKQLLKLHIQHNSRFILYTISGIYQSRFQHIFLLATLTPFRCPYVMVSPLNST